ncbi:DUF3626 domain-containing protein [Nocardia sp. NPDC004168]|uniref:DUF3626 domain-containing protein n=1 Tax=Nocardia sp. NPDC004168 TaxID=3154452 RepID=UPI0033AB2C3A
MARSTDVEALALDPSYRGTAVHEAADRLGCRVERHPGFLLSVDRMRCHPDFSGPRYVELGTAIAVGDRLDPRIIGDAARTSGAENTTDRGGQARWLPSSGLEARGLGRCSGAG